MSDNILVNAIKEIARMTKPQLYGIDGHKFASDDLVEIRPKEDAPAVLTVHTLQGLVDHVQIEGIRFAMKGKPLFVEVCGYDTVVVRGALESGENTEYLRRTYYRTESDVPNFRCGWMGLEERIIQLRAQCADTAGRTALLEMLSSVSKEEGAVSNDNGVTQEVTVREGVAIKAPAAVQPYVKLQPYRTFLEVEQPESEFLLRLGKECEVGLFEADGGAWKLEAARKIRTWLESMLAAQIDAGLVVVTL